MIKDLTKGEPLKLILLFSVPLLIGNIFQQLYNIADIVIVGRTLGVNCLAAVGAVAPLFFLIMFAVVGLNNGFAVITGQKFGAKDFDGVRRSVAISTILSTIFTIIFTIICTVFMKPMLFIMNVPQDIIHNAYWYIQICVWGLVTVNFYNLLASIVRALGDSKTPLYFLILASILNVFLALLFILKFGWGVPVNFYNLLASIVRALGDSKTPLYFLILASILNVFLALLFILKFGWGVPGSAIAVVLSQGFSALLCVFYIKLKFPILHMHKSDWKFNLLHNKEDIKFAKEHLAVGIPMVIQFTVIGLGVLIIQSVCNSFGANVIAAFTAALRIEQIATMPMISFGIALAAFVAQNFGAKKISRIRQGVIRSSIINIILSLVMAFIIHKFGSNIVQIFIGSQSKQVIKVAHDYLWISTIFYFFLGQIFIFRNALQGMGKPLIPLTSSFAELMIRSYAAVYLAVKYSYFGIFYAGPIAWITASIILTIGYFINIKKLIKKQILKKSTS